MALQRIRMQKTKLFHLWTIFLLIIITLALLIYVSIGNNFGPGSKTQLLEPKSKFIFLTTNRFLIVLQSVIFPVSSWSSIIAPSFMLSVLAAVIGNEFEACNSDLDNSMMIKGNELSKEDLAKMTDRFCELAAMVKRVDAMFSYSGIESRDVARKSVCCCLLHCTGTKHQRLDTGA